MKTRILVMDYENMSAIILDNVDTWDIEHNYDNDYERYLVDKINYSPKSMDFMVGLNKIEFLDAEKQETLLFYSLSITNFGTKGEEIMSFGLMLSLALALWSLCCIVNEIIIYKSKKK